MASRTQLSELEIIILIIIAVLADIFEIVIGALTAIPVVGVAFIPVIWGIDFLAWAVIQGWLWRRGIRQFYFTAGSLIEALPFPLVSIFPTRTIVLILTIYVSANLPVPNSDASSSSLTERGKVVVSGRASSSRTSRGKIIKKSV